MSVFLHNVFSFPTLLFTVPLVIVLLYWLMVIVGALDVDLFGVGGDVDGALDGALDGAAEGAAEGAADAVDGLDGPDELDAADHATGGLATLLAYLKLRTVPLTVVISLVVFYGWCVTFWGSSLFGLSRSVFLIRWLVGAGVVVGALGLALVCTAVTARPLGKLFVVQEAPSRSDLFGQLCVVTTGKVNATFGQAQHEDGGAGMVLPVRCRGTQTLKRGDSALIVDYDEEQQAYTIEPDEGATVKTG